MHAAEDDVLRVRPLGGVLRQHERIATLIGELDDVLALVVVAEHHGAITERCSRRPHPLHQLVGLQCPVLVGDLRLPGAERDLLAERDRLNAAVGLTLKLRDTSTDNIERHAATAHPRESELSYLVY